VPQAAGHHKEFVRSRHLVDGRDRARGQVDRLECGYLPLAVPLTTDTGQPREIVWNTTQ
jgi:hypothetical protein